jgi:hypothetical protein
MILNAMGMKMSISFFLSSLMLKAVMRYVGRLILFDVNDIMKKSEEVFLSGAVL